MEKSAIIWAVMEAPPVHYVTTKDGYSIAYTVSGEGRPFVLLPTWMNHVQDIWKEDFGDGFPQALSKRYQLVNYDARGMGMSSRGLPQDLTLDSYILDLEAVLDRLGIQRFVLLGSHSSALLAGHYALRHPDRVAALILMNCGTRWLGADIPSLWEELPRESWEAFLFTFVAPSDEGHNLLETVKGCITQADYLASVRVWRNASLESALTQLHTPTLVLKPQDCPCSSLESAMELARLLPNGRLVLMAGALAFGPPGQAIHAIEEFLTEVDASARCGDKAQDGRSSVRLAPPAGLSPRQVQVLRLIAEGKTNGEIADELVISLRTVERHVAELYAKIGARNRVEAAAFAMNQLAKA